MRVLVTGCSGHLGEALSRTLAHRGDEVIGLDIKESRFVTTLGSIADSRLVEGLMHGVDVVFHTATLHKPHLATHTRQAFVDTNVSGTLALLEAALSAKVKAFIFTSTTSVFGDAMKVSPGQAAAWITEDVTPQPKNIYGVTKAAAEDICQLFHRNQGLPVIVLRTSRFFPEADDNSTIRQSFEDENAKANEYLYRRVDLEDVVSAHLLAAQKASMIGFGKYIISATTPFQPDDVLELSGDAPSVVRRYCATFEREYARRGWRMFDSLDRVYCNSAARLALGWRPQHDFNALIERLVAGGSVASPLGRLVGVKGYHDKAFHDGPYPVENGLQEPPA